MREWESHSFYLAIRIIVGIYISPAKSFLHRKKLLAGL